VVAERGRRKEEERRGEKIRGEERRDRGEISDPRLGTPFAPQHHCMVLSFKCSPLFLSIAKYHMELMSLLSPWLLV
jgi:hypothetical protein